jgi:hypothetical protein
MAIISEINIPTNEIFNCSAFKINELISSNKDEYWCWNNTNVFEIYLKIKKDSKEGKEITKCLADKPEDTDIVLLQKVIDSIIIANMSDYDIVDTLKQYSKNIYNEAYTKGQKDKAKDFRKLLNL